MKIGEDRFLADIFGFAVFKVEVSPGEMLPEDLEQATVSILRPHLAQQKRAFYYSKVDTDRIEVVRPLSAAGFYPVDVNVTFGIGTESGKNPLARQKTSGFKIGAVEGGQQEAALEIARTAFAYSRFHLDPLVPKATADRIKHDWILNYLKKKRGEHLWIASVAGRPAGFLAVLASTDRGKEVRTIDLIGVSRDYRRQGIGLALTQFFINHYWDQCHYLQVGTQIANLPSLGLYQKAGFQVAKTAYVMHLHVQDGSPIS